jgi:hypothetical protein
MACMASSSRVTVGLAALRSLGADQCYGHTVYADCADDPSMGKRGKTKAKYWPTAATWRNAAGNTHLHHAAHYGCVDEVQALIALGAPLGAVNAAGASPLHIAALIGHSAIAHLLLDAGAALGAVDKLGRTPLNLARDFGENEVAGVIEAAIASRAAIDALRALRPEKCHKDAQAGKRTTTASTSKRAYKFARRTKDLMCSGECKEHMVEHRRRHAHKATPGRGFHHLYTCPVRIASEHVRAHWDER